MYHDPELSKTDKMLQQLMTKLLKENDKTFKASYKQSLSFEPFKLLTIFQKLHIPLFNKSTIIPDREAPKTIKRADFETEELFEEAFQAQQLTRKFLDLREVLVELDNRVKAADIPYYSLGDLKQHQSFEEIQRSCKKLVFVENVSFWVSAIIGVIAAIAVFVVILAYTNFLKTDNDLKLIFLISFVVFAVLFTAVPLIFLVPINLMTKSAFRLMNQKDGLMSVLRSRGRAIRKIADEWCREKALPERNIAVMSGPFGMTLWLILVAPKDSQEKSDMLNVTQSLPLQLFNQISDQKFAELVNIEENREFNINNFL